MIKFHGCVLWTLTNPNRFGCVESNQFHFNLERIKRFSFLLVKNQFLLLICVFKFNSVHHLIDTKDLCKRNHNHCSRKTSVLLKLHNRAWFTGWSSESDQFSRPRMLSAREIFQLKFHEVRQTSDKSFDDNSCCIAKFSVLLKVSSNVNQQKHLINRLVVWNTTF